LTVTALSQGRGRFGDGYRIPVVKSTFALRAFARKHHPPRPHPAATPSATLSSHTRMRSIRPHPLRPEASNTLFTGHTLRQHTIRLHTPPGGSQPSSSELDPATSLRDQPAALFCARSGHTPLRSIQPHASGIDPATHPWLSPPLNSPVEATRDTRCGRQKPQKVPRSASGGRKSDRVHRV